MNVTLTPDVRQRLDAHLDAVEQTLAGSGRSREQRRGIVDDLEAQIQDMLAARSQTPALADLEAVLAQLDPPSAYGDGATRAAVAPQSTPASCAPITGPGQVFEKAFPPRGARYARTAIWGLVCILVSLLPMPLLAVGALFLRAVLLMSSRSMRRPNSSGRKYLCRMGLSSWSNNPMPNPGPF